VDSCIFNLPMSAMKNMTRLAVVLVLLIAVHAVPIWYGIAKESANIAPPTIRGLVGGAFVPNFKANFGWIEVPDGTVIVWHIGEGITCDLLETARPMGGRPKTDVPFPWPKSADPRPWSSAVKVLADPTNSHAKIREAAFGAPIRFLVRRQAYMIDSRSNSIAIAFPGDSDPAARWDISYGRLLASILLYLVPIWFVYGLFPRVRRYLRRRRGCCGECAYPLKGLNTTTCPECGHVNEGTDAAAILK
jgi:hypothetical protein